MAEVWANTKSQNKNVHVQVSGKLSAGETLDWREVVTVASGFLRLDSVRYAISDKVEVLLAWDKEGDESEPHVFLPLAARGSLDFDGMNGVENTVKNGRTGHVLIQATSTRETSGHFLLMLDFSKQGN